MTDPSRDQLLDIAVEAVQRAGKLVLDSRPRTITDKGDRDLTSDVDLASEQAIRDHLAFATPNIPVFGEEGGGADPAAEQSWIVDPVDGTFNFVHGLPHYAVALSLVDNGTTTHAATYIPESDDIYTARLGGGAHCNGTPIAASDVSALRDALVAIDQLTFTGRDPQQVNDHRLGLIARLAPLVGRIRIHGTSAIDLAWTAHGKLDASIIVANKPWDTSGGVLLVREAGAVAIDLEGDPQTFSSTTTLVAAPRIIDELSARIRQPRQDP